ncbi:molybdenum cofactor guanylyltransferase [Bacillus niameyensis]|uniref:molybdenum cofactor guanylyltransferase n=1 Tax=Bacillus niameyensis TaxID=1522308 RepID=UPI000780B908|nr:molybdenum cofactor guanylyltransferase [Bacillus niameyensis]
MNTIILAGGRSSRMGQNKALMKLNGEQVIKRLIKEFEPISKKVILIANDHSPYTNLGVKVKEDILGYRGQGPLAGMYTGLKEVSTGYCLVVACDMPFAAQELALKMVKMMTEYDCDAVIPVTDQHTHPLFSIYNARIVDQVKAVLETERRSMKALIERLNVKFHKIDKDLEVVWNMNTLEDYFEAVKMAERNM